MKSRHIRILAFFIIAFTAYVMEAEPPVVVDSESGQPIARFSIFDRHGKMIGTGDDNGRMPDFGRHSYPLTLRSLGYADKKISFSADSLIGMTRSAVDLPVLNVSTRHRPILHLTGYVREISTMTAAASQWILTSGWAICASLKRKPIHPKRN